jgi:excinuclease ABC subunit B
MAKSPAKSSRPDGSEFDVADLDGFAEAPQPKLSGAPAGASGSIADWAADLAKEAELEAVKARRKEENRALRSQAGKHRLKAGKSRDEAAPPAKGKAPATEKSKKTARGTSIGSSNDPRARAAAGLNAVAGLDISVEEAEASGATSANTATVRGAVGADRERQPAVQERQDLDAAPPGATGATSRPRSPIWWRAPTRTSATRCCSASPARARPSPWPR